MLKLDNLKKISEFEKIESYDDLCNKKKIAGEAAIDYLLDTLDKLKKR